MYRSLFSETFSCVASPVQFAAVKAYEYSDELKHYVADSATILSGVSSFIYENLVTHKISATNPQGAFYMMVGFDQFKNQINSKGIYTSEELAIYLLENYQVALLPGSDFGFQDSEFFFRLAFVDFDGKNVMKAFKGKIDNDFIKKECPNMFTGTHQLIQFAKDL